MEPASDRRGSVTAADHTLATDLARRAGELLVDLRTEMTGAGLSSRRLKDEGDRRSNDLLLEGLAERVREGDAVLSEEARDDLARLDARRVWIVDPLDGTREFGEPPRSDWAVHVALCVDGSPAAGAVALPAEARVLGTRPSCEVPARGNGPVKLAVSRSRPPAEAMAVAGDLDAEMVPMGSAGVKAMAVVSGEVDIYLHAGGQYEWDSCAPAAVAAAAGLHTSRADGSPLRYNNRDPYLPDLLICRPELAEPVLDTVRTLWS